MNQRIFAPTLCAMLFALCVPVGAQQPKKVTQIGSMGKQLPDGLYVSGGPEYLLTKNGSRALR
jgi:hypothetical protein